MNRRLEDRIRILCQDVLDTHDDDEQARSVGELRGLLPHYIECFRARVAAHAVERRRPLLTGKSRRQTNGLEQSVV
jgi:hypothetical protein